MRSPTAASAPRIKRIAWIIAASCVALAAFFFIRPKTNPHDHLAYVWIPPGSYLTGCNLDDEECMGRERPREKTVIAKGFWIGRTEVTQSAFQRVMNANPSRYLGPDRPVEQVDWYAATAYCNKIAMRLPTESEWEYSALGKLQQPRYGSLDHIAWFDGNSNDMTHAVAQKQPNSYGLFDMLGNVWEWIQDPFPVDPKAPHHEGRFVLQHLTRSARAQPRNPARYHCRTAT